MNNCLLGTLSLVFLAAGGCVVARAAATAPTPPATAPVLVELFTSQGCSSCPAADAFLRDLPRLGLGRDHVVPLAFHVDYWDDLGWKDPFATPAFTERQRRYVRGGRLAAPDGQDGIRGAYTPQLIVAGAVHLSGGRRDAALAEITRAAGRPALANLMADATVNGDQALVTARLSSAAPRETRQSWRLVVALSAKGARTPVARGENGGRTLDEAAIVRALSEPVAIGDGPMQVVVTKPPELAWDAVEIAAFVQSTTTMHVVAARAVNVTQR